MPQKTSLSALCFVLFAALNARAQSANCPPELQWTEATSQQRITPMEGQLAEARVEVFANATVSTLDIGGDKAGVLAMKAGHGFDGINLTFGKDQPKPFDFAEISMAVAPPMVDLSFPSFATPCAVNDIGPLPFSEQDLAPADRRDMPTLKFQGTLQRTGLRIAYSMTLQEGGTAKAGSETSTGTWRYEQTLKNFPLDTDVQGWHVYRGNTFLMTLPAGRPLALSAALKQVGQLPIAAGK